MAALPERIHRSSARRIEFTPCAKLQGNLIQYFDMSVTILSGPVGSGKTTVAQELLALLPAPVSYIEGDTFWSFIGKNDNRDRRELFTVIMRSMTAASIPFARSGFEVILDFSIPPQFLETARKILKDVPLNYIMLRPSLSVCEARASLRPEGKISDYTTYRDFYTLFEGPSPYSVCDDESNPSSVARQLFEGLAKNKFRVG